MTAREIQLDQWQQDVLDYQGNIAIRSGRQTGKSTVISMKAMQFAELHPDTTTMIVAPAQRQSSLLFEKIRFQFDVKNEASFRPHVLEKEKEFTRQGKAMPWWVKKQIQDEHGIYAEPPTQTKLTLKNGSKIYSLPAGRTGDFIRGFAIDLLIVDEAAYVPESVWNAVIPMIAVSRETRSFGFVILLGTPFGKGGYFYTACHDKDFKQFHVSSEQCARIPRDFLKKEKTRMSKMEYQQEYLAEFVDEFNQLFPSELIKKRMTFMEWDYKTQYSAEKNYYLGVDIARFGGDENAFVFGELHKDVLRIIKVETTERKGVTDTIGRIKAYDQQFHFRKVFIDSGGVGGAVYDLLAEAMGKIKVVGLDNATREVDAQGKKKTLLKEDLYSHSLSLMEFEEMGKPKKIELINDLDLARSLKSMTFEYTQDRNLRIYGAYSHIAEAFVRCCWATKAKGLRLFLA